MDLFHRMRQRMGPLGQYAQEAHHYYTYPILEGPLGPHMVFQGKAVLNWSLNNYLGLGNDPEVRKVDAEAAERWGAAYPMGARMMSGNTALHEQLEAELADLARKEDSFLLNFGYQGVLSILDAVLDRQDVVIYDAESHACIVDGLRLHAGKRYVYAHNDMEALKKQLQRAERITEQTGGGILVITEGVFGMSGVQGALKEIAALKEAHEFRLFVDDAHGFGILGEQGAGTGVHQGVQEHIDLYFSTFAKSMASIGAFVAAERSIISYLKYNMRSQIFAKSLPMLLVEGARYRLKRLKEGEELRSRLWDNVNALQNGLRKAGFELGGTRSCVTPVYLNGTVDEATALTADLRENFGIFCSMVVYPVVPKGVILLRLIPTAAHRPEDVQRTLDAFRQIKSRLDAGAYRSMGPAA